VDTQTLYELIGYLASGLIVVSLLMSSILRLRLIGLVGAISFTAYGVLIDAYPIAVANGAIIFIHIFHLTRMLRQRAPTRTSRRSRSRPTRPSCAASSSSTPRTPDASSRTSRACGAASSRCWCSVTPCRWARSWPTSRARRPT
jgi:hypothetical protein